MKQLGGCICCAPAGVCCDVTGLPLTLHLTTPRVSGLAITRASTSELSWNACINWTTPAMTNSSGGFCIGVTSSQVIKLRHELTCSVGVDGIPRWIITVITVACTLSSDGLRYPRTNALCNPAGQPILTYGRAPGNAAQQCSPVSATMTYDNSLATNPALAQPYTNGDSFTLST